MNENKILEACMQVLEGGEPHKDTVNCDSFYCSVCPFSSVNNNNICCGDDTQENYIKIAKEYIEKNLPSKKENKIEKSFREVIADIKEGEVWESVQDCFQLSEITCFEGRIRFRLKNVFVDIVDGNNNVDTGAGGGQTFKLKRKEYTFEEAYKSTKEGLEIESLVSGIKYKKYDENTMMFKDRDMDDFSGIDNDGALFSVDEINGKWYINN